MIQVDSLRWVNEAWEARARIREGVYHLDSYPVRITHLAYTDNLEVQSALKVLVRGLLERHMRRGTVPPHAMVMNWSRSRGILEGASEDLERALRVVAQSNLLEVGSAVSNHF